MKEKIAWGGFCDNRLAITKEQITNRRIYAIYINKRVARLCYEDVRKIIIAQKLNK